MALSYLASSNILNNINANIYFNSFHFISFHFISFHFISLILLICTNDIKKYIKSNVAICFVGDTVLFSMINAPVISADELNHD